MICQAKKLLQFLGGRLQPGKYGLNLVRVSMYMTSFNYMAQVLYGSLTKETLLPLGKYLCTTQPFKHTMQVQHVLLSAWVKH